MLESVQNFGAWRCGHVGFLIFGIRYACEEHHNLNTICGEQFSVPMANLNLAALTLANICLDVQIGICMCLHLSDILSLRKVCPPSEVFVAQISEVLLSRLVKLLNVSHGNG